jgi:hypothetical protein
LDFSIASSTASRLILPACPLVSAHCSLLEEHPTKENKLPPTIIPAEAIPLYLKIVAYLSKLYFFFFSVIKGASSYKIGADSLGMWENHKEISSVF